MVFLGLFLWTHFGVLLRRASRRTFFPLFFVSALSSRFSAVSKRRLSAFGGNASPWLRLFCLRKTVSGRDALSSRDSANRRRRRRAFRGRKSPVGYAVWGRVELGIVCLGTALFACSVRATSRATACGSCTQANSGRGSCRRSFFRPIKTVR